MKIIEIDGGRKLNGTIRVSGAKNATVALIPAAILTDEEATLCNIPEITDTEALCDILKELKLEKFLKLIILLCHKWFKLPLDKYNEFT